jgi:hypothetical protein
MKTLLFFFSMIIFGQLALAAGPQPRHDYDNAGFYQPELDASVRWMAKGHALSIEETKAQYTFYWQFPVNYIPQQSMVISFYGPHDNCRVVADDLRNIQGQCFEK